jgi:hypothetical protein
MIAALIAVKLTLGSKIGEPYGHPTPLEIEGPTLPPGGFHLSELRPAYLPASPGLSTLHHPAHAHHRLGIPRIGEYYSNRITY